MKRFIALLLSVLMLAACFAGCHKDTEEAEDSTATAEETTKASKDTTDLDSTTKKSKSGKSSVKEVDGNYVEVTFPSSYYSGYDEEDIIAASEESGYKSCKVNKDGSVTYTMTEDQLQELKDEMQDTIDDTIASITTGDSATGTISKVKYNKDMSKFNVYVDGDSYSEMTTLNAILFYTSASYYQTISGVAEEDVDITVNFIDKDTDEVLDTETYADYLAMYGD